MSEYDRFLRSRREFFRLAALALSALPAFPRLSRAATPRRHLINISGNGGWDAHSFHCGFDPGNAAAPVIEPEEAKVEAESDGGTWTPRNRGYDTGDDYFPHPLRSECYMGPGFSLFKGSDLLKEEMAIIQGMYWADGGHGTGQAVLNCGMRSRYAASYSGLIAQRLARSKLLPLHYVQLAEPKELFTHQGIIGGSGEPTVVQDLEALGSLVRGVDHPDRRVFVNHFVKRLAEDVASAKFTKEASTELFQSFQAAYSGAMLITTSDWVTPGSELAELINDYRRSVRKTVQGHGYWERYTRLVDSDWRTDLNRYAERMAMTEFFIRKNLTAVADVKMPAGDFHTNNQTEGIKILATFAAVKKLMENLKAEGLLDHTTIVMHTEWDRAAPFSIGNTEHPGTGHGRSASVVMAGAGVKPGVIGGIGHGSGPLSLEGSRLGFGLPVDPATGLPSAGGQQLYIENVFPTVLKIFETPVPSQQITNHKAIESVVA